MRIGTQVWMRRSSLPRPTATEPLIVVAGAGTGKTRTLVSGWRRWSTAASIRSGSCC